MMYVAGSLCLALSAVAAGQGEELDEALALLEQSGATRISVDWQDETLPQVFADLESRTSIPLRVDWEALDRLGVRRGDEITLRLRSSPLSTVLAAMTLQLGDEYERPVTEAHAGQIVLTTREATAAMRLTDVYDVRDLLTDEATLERLREETPAASMPDEPEAEEGDAEPERETEDPEEEGEGDDKAASEPRRPGFQLPSIDELVGDAPPPEPCTPGEELMLLITEHVDPDAWLEMGGSRALISEREGVLLVTAPPTTHRKFREALAKLRKASPSSVLLEAAIIDLPRASFQRLAGRYEMSSAALGRSILLAEDVAVRWQIASAVALDQHLAVESDAEGLTVKLAMTPRLDKETGILSLSVDANSVQGDDRRSVRTTVAVRYRLGGAVLELPAAKAGPTVRLLVLIPERL